MQNNVYSTVPTLQYKCNHVAKVNKSVKIILTVTSLVNSIELPSVKN